MAPAKHKLKLSKLTFLSLVDVPAQEPASVRLIKRAPQGDEVEVKATARIVKVSPGDDPLIYAWAFQCVGDDGASYSDLQGDTITPDFVKAAEEFMRSGGAVDTQHNEQQTSRVAFAFPMDSDIATSMFGAPGAAIKTVGLMTAIRASSDDLAGVRSGKYTGVSIMGTGIREALKTAAAPPCPTCTPTPAAKSLTKCQSCDAYGDPDAAGKCASCGKAMKRAPRRNKPLRKNAVLTSAVDGHQHQVSLDDPANGWSGQLTTSYNTSDGADNGHSHAWVYDAATGKITIATDSGHTHDVDAVVPADIIRQAALNESGKRCGSCSEMCEEGCRFCPHCGAAMGGNGVPKAPCSDENSGSGAAVVIVAARAPDPNSPPPEATPTVKSETKEHATMATDALQILTDKHDKLEKRNVFLEKFSQLSDAEKAHYEKLVGQDKDVFLNKSALERQVEISEIAKADEIIYTSPVTGEVYRKSSNPRELKLQKQADEATIAHRDEARKRADAELAQKGAAIFTNIAKGAKGNIPGRLMKAISNEFSDVTEYEEVIDALKGLNNAMGMLMKANGTSASPEPSPSDPNSQLEALVKRHVAEKNVTYPKAYAAVLETPEGQRLYSQIPTARA